MDHSLKQGPTCQRHDAQHTARVALARMAHAHSASVSTRRVPVAAAAALAHPSLLAAEHSLYSAETYGAAL